MAKLKKGSAAAKAWGRKMKRLRNKPKSKRKYSAIKSKPKRRMAKRKKTTKRRSKKSLSIMGINSAKAISAMLYGGVRMKTSNAIAKYTSRLPLGNISDEAGMLLVSTLGKKYLFKSAGTMRDALTAGQTIELARIGEAVATGQVGNILGGLFNGGNQAPTGNGYVFQ